jgi:hypothetical protein
MPEIELSELIENLRCELSKARSAGEGQDLRFELGQVELDVCVAVSKEGSGSGAVKFWVMELGAQAKAALATTQQMKLTLIPQLAGGGKALVAGRAEARER